MQIISKNDQNIKRVYPKMSDHFLSSPLNNLSNNNPSTTSQLSNSVEAVVNFFEKNQLTADKINDIRQGRDHMYATNTENGEIVRSEADFNSAEESEVKFWKDWLMLHLDLIQQQNDEIVNKERTILILQQENEMVSPKLYRSAH